MCARRTLSLAANLKTIIDDTQEKDLSSAMFVETNLDIKVSLYLVKSHTTT